MLRYDDGFMILPILSIWLQLLWLQLPPLLTVASRDFRPPQVEVIDAMRAEENTTIEADA